MASISKRRWMTQGSKDRPAQKRSAWEVSYIDQAKKRHRKQFTKKKDADAWLVNARAEVASGTHLPDSQSITVAEAADIWLSACQRGRDGRDPVEPHTFRAYESHVRVHIVPLIGVELLSQMTAPKVAEFRDALIDTKSRAMAKKVLSSFKAIIGEAQARGLVAQNVAMPVSITMADRHKARVQIPSKTEIGVIIAKAEALTSNPQPHIAKAWRRYHAFLLTAVMTGMRASELRGLYWSNIDLNNGAINVCQRADEIGVIGSVKSGAGRRRITLPQKLIQVLREWRMPCPPGELVFPNWQGNVETHANITNRCWYSISQRCGLATVENIRRGNGERAIKRISPKYRLHSLRHFHASMLIASGASPKEVQVEMGHSSIQVTFDRYGHLFPEDDEKRVQRAAAMEADIFG